MQIRTQYVLKNNKVLNRCPKIMQPSLRKRCEYESRNYLAVGLIQRDRLEIKTKKKKKKKENKGSAKHMRLQHLVSARAGGFLGTWAAESISDVQHALKPPPPAAGLSQVQRSRSLPSKSSCTFPLSKSH